MYLKQLDDYSCGPIALLNTLIWSGCKNISHKDLVEAEERCNTDKDGTYDSDLNSALRSLQFNYSVVKPRNVNFKRMQDHLKLGGAIIGAYKETGGLKEWHYSLFISHPKMKDVAWNVVNYSNGYTCTEMLDMPSLWMYERLDKSAIWLLEKVWD